MILRYKTSFLTMNFLNVKLCYVMSQELTFMTLSLIPLFTLSSHVADIRCFRACFWWYLHARAVQIPVVFKLMKSGVVQIKISRA